MLAYNSKDLYNRIAQKQASDAFINGCVDEEGLKRLLAAAPSGLYTPQHLFSIGIALITLIAYCFGVLIIAWGSEFSSAALITFLAAAGAYMALEAGVKQRRFYNAGADNMLLMLIPATVIAFCFVEIKHMQPLFTTLIAGVICCWLCVRFVDALMALLTTVAIVMLYCLLLDRAGLAAVILPVAALLPAVLMYIVSGLLLKSDSLIVYTWCLKVVRITALAIVYACSNCLVVDVVFTGSYDYRVSGAWKIFYLSLQVIVPVVYVIAGIRKRNMVLLRAGVIAAALSAYTFHYYYSFLPADVVLLIAGCILITVSLLLIRVLQQGQRAFSAEPESNAEKLLKQAEADIVFQILGKKGTAVTPVNPFGGGSSGGAGASGSY